MNFMIVLFHLIRGVAVSTSVVKSENWQGCAACCHCRDVLDNFSIFHFHARFSFILFIFRKKWIHLAFLDLVSLIQLKHISPSWGRKLGNFNFSTRALFIIFVFFSGPIEKRLFFFPAQQSFNFSTFLDKKLLRVLEVINLMLSDMFSNSQGTRRSELETWDDLIFRPRTQVKVYKKDEKASGHEWKSLTTANIPQFLRIEQRAHSKGKITILSEWKLNFNYIQM